MAIVLSERYCTARSRRTWSNIDSNVVPSHAIMEGVKSFDLNSLLRIETLAGSPPKIVIAKQVQSGNGLCHVRRQLAVGRAVRED
jgi:hypothetical protein